MVPRAALDRLRDILGVVYKRVILGVVYKRVLHVVMGVPICEADTRIQGKCDGVVLRRRRVGAGSSR